MSLRREMKSPVNDALGGKDETHAGGMLHPSPVQPSGEYIGGFVTCVPRPFVENILVDSGPVALRHSSAYGLLVHWPQRPLSVRLKCSDFRGGIAKFVVHLRRLQDVLECVSLQVYGSGVQAPIVNCLICKFSICIGNPNPLPVRA